MVEQMLHNVGPLRSHVPWATHATADALDVKFVVASKCRENNKEQHKPMQVIKMLYKARGASPRDTRWGEKQQQCFQVHFISTNHTSFQQHHCVLQSTLSSQAEYLWGKWPWRLTGRGLAPRTWAWRWSCRWSRWLPPGRWGPSLWRYCCWRGASAMEQSLVWAKNNAETN